MSSNVAWSNDTSAVSPVILGNFEDIPFLLDWSDIYLENNYLYGFMQMISISQGVNGTINNVKLYNNIMKSYASGSANFFCSLKLGNLLIKYVEAYGNTFNEVALFYSGSQSNITIENFKFTKNTFE